MRFPFRLPAAHRFSLSTAAAIAAIAVLGTPGAASITARPTFHVLAPPSQVVPAHGPLTFTPFTSAPLNRTAQDLTVGPDGNLWITTQGNPGTIVRMTPKGVSKAFTYPVGTSGSLSLSITPGPDGALWFVDNDADLVGKVTTKGVVTTYPLPTNQGPCGNLDASQPLGITAGPDGAMWFTVSEGVSGSLTCPPGQNVEIGRITTTGQMTFYPVPEIQGYIGSIAPFRITAGPDGLLWFTTCVCVPYQQLGVGSITTSGAITVGNGFPGTSEQDSGDYLTFSANSLYVANTQNATIINVSNYAPAATYPIPGFSGDGYGPFGITSDAKGQLWFTTRTDGDNEQLGSMTRKGQFTLYQVPPSFGYGCCGSLAFRGKHDLWFPYDGASSANVIEATNVP